MSASTIRSCLRRAFWLEPSCVYLEIQTIDGLLAYRRLSAKPSYHLSPSSLILSMVSISSAPSDMSQLEPSTRLSRMWKTSAGCIKSWILCHQGEVGRILGGDVLIVMHSRSHMTVDTCIPTYPGRSSSGFHLPGKHSVKQARCTVRCSASCMKGEQRLINNRS